MYYRFSVLLDVALQYYFKRRITYEYMCTRNRIQHNILIAYARKDVSLNLHGQYPHCVVGESA